MDPVGGSLVMAGVLIREMSSFMQSSGEPYWSGRVRGLSLRTQADRSRKDSDPDSPCEDSACSLPQGLRPVTYVISLKGPDHLSAKILPRVRLQSDLSPRGFLLLPIFSAIS